VLAGVVGGPLGHAHQARHRGDVDDRSLSLFEHRRAECLAEQERTGQVHLQDPSPLLRCRLLSRRDQRDAGVVDQNIDAPVRVQYRPGGVGHVVLAGHVTRQAERAVHLRRLNIDECKLMAGVGEHLGDALPDPLRGPGHHGNSHAATLLPRRPRDLGGWW